MNLKPEFVSLMTKNIKESEKKILAMGKTPKGKQIPKSNVKPVTYSTLDSSFKEKTFFEMLSASSGYREVISWLARKVNVLEGPADLNSKESKENEVYEYDEYKVYQIFKEVFSEVFEYQIQEMFDLFESKISSKISSNDIYLMVAYVAAAESIQTLEYLHLFADVIFNSLSMNQSMINCSRMKAFGKLLGVSERRLLSLMKEFNLKEDQDIVLEEFELFFFAIFEDMENSIAKISTLVGNSSAKKEPYKNKTCKKVCTIF